MRMRRNGLKLHQWKLSLDNWKTFFTQRVVRHWSKFSREVLESRLGNVQEVTGCGTYGDGLGGAGLTVGLDDLEVLFQS